MTVWQYFTSVTNKKDHSLFNELQEVLLLKEKYSLLFLENNLHVGSKSQYKGHKHLLPSWFLSYPQTKL